MKIAYLGLIFAILQMSSHWAYGFGHNNFTKVSYPFSSLSYENEVLAPVAANDTFMLAVGCGNFVLEGNLLENDSYEKSAVWLSEIRSTKNGIITYNSSGDFSFRTNENFRGNITLTYRLTEIEDASNYTEAQLTIFVEDDYDCDKVINRLDLDCDNDGILDIHEGEEDADGDGVPNCFDIDSDNDGITDFTEWQLEGFEKSLQLSDANKDGWDDRFDSHEGGDYYELVDSDFDGVPDFLDTDSDNDGISDYVEAFDVSNTQKPALKFTYLDSDGDGLDDSFDSLDSEVSRLNPMGSISPLPDHNNDNIRDWRDPFNYQMKIEEQDAKIIPEELTVFPNPVIDWCKVYLPELEELDKLPYSLKIYSTKGELVHLELVNSRQHQLFLGNLERGLYFMRIKIGNTTLSTKIIRSE